MDGLSNEIRNLVRANHLLYPTTFGQVGQGHAAKGHNNPRLGDLQDFAGPVPASFCFHWSGVTASWESTADQVGQEVLYFSVVQA